MPLSAALKLILTESEHKQLLALSRHRGTPKGILLRVNIILGASEGIANHVLARNRETSLPTVLLWRRRFESDGLAGILEDRPRSGRPKEIPEERETGIVEATIHTTPKDARVLAVSNLMQTSQV